MSPTFLFLFFSSKSVLNCERVSFLLLFASSLHFNDRIFLVGPITEPALCPTGHYCPVATGRSNSFPCIPGTYRPLEGGEQLSDCRDCEPGSYCLYPGLFNVSGDCYGGYYCTGGAISPNPRNESVKSRYTEYFR